MYEIWLDEKILYYPGDKEAVVTSAVLNEALNDSGYFEFTIPITNPLYSQIFERNSLVTVKKDAEEIFHGEVREITTNSKKEKQVYCVGELAFLMASIQPQAKHQNQTPLQLFSTFLSIHNSQVEKRKQFTLGMVTVTDKNDSIYHFTNYENTLTAIREKLCDTLNGYLRIRKEKDVRYLDLVSLEDYGKRCEQTIQFGTNLLKYSDRSSGEEIATAVIPLGKRLEESKIEGLDSYVTIESVNQGKDYVAIPEAVERFGWVKVVKHWDNVTLPENLKKKAEEWLQSVQYESLTLELNAIDLSLMDQSMDSFCVGDFVHASAEPFGMNTWFPVQTKKTDLLNLSKNEITLSNTIKKSYTEQIDAKINQVTAELVNQSKIIELAKLNASNIIKAATNGNVVLKMDENGNPEELLIMDTKDIHTAKRVWRWNLNGFAYSNTGYNGNFETAITMDGTIVGNFIAANTICAEHLNVEYKKEVQKNISTMGEQANQYTDGKLKEYPTTITMETSIRNSAEQVEIAASKKYETIQGNNEKLKNYPTKLDTESMIRVKAEEITLAVSRTLISYSTTEETKSLISSKANEITLAVSEVLRSYSTTEETKSLISSKASEITLAVSQTLNDYSTKEELNTRLLLELEKITTEVSKKIGNEELGTQIEQNYKNVVIAWNKESKNVQFENGEILLYDGAISDLAKRIILSHRGLFLYKNGNFMGDIGLGSTQGFGEGLGIGISNKCNYIAIAAQDQKGDMYAKAEYLSGEDRVRFHCPVTFDHGFSGEVEFLAPLGVNSQGQLSSWKTVRLKFESGLLIEATGLY